jgi:hypothetical protein
VTARRWRAAVKEETRGVLPVILVFVFLLALFIHLLPSLVEFLSYALVFPVRVCTSHTRFHRAMMQHPAESIEGGVGVRVGAGVCFFLFVLLLAMRCDAMRCDAMRCDAVRCGAMRCDAVRCDAMRFSLFVRCRGSCVWVRSRAYLAVRRFAFAGALRVSALRRLLLRARVAAIEVADAAFAPSARCKLARVGGLGLAHPVRFSSTVRLALLWKPYLIGMVVMGQRIREMR